MARIFRVLFHGGEEILEGRSPAEVLAARFPDARPARIVVNRWTFRGPSGEFFDVVVERMTRDGTRRPPRLSKKN